MFAALRFPLRLPLTSPLFTASSVPLSLLLASPLRLLIRFAFLLVRGIYSLFYFFNCLGIVLLQVPILCHIHAVGLGPYTLDFLKFCIITGAYKWSLFKIEKCEMGQREGGD